MKKFYIAVSHSFLFFNRIGSLLLLRSFVLPYRSKAEPTKPLVTIILMAYFHA